MVKLTIVIPYFDTYELTVKLLRELSLQRNGNNEVEIILIDDFCENEFNKTYSKDDILLKGGITIMHHIRNEGVSKSRNDGLELAQGKYIAFIDSDDMVMPNYIETLLYLIDNRDEDIIYFNWLDINNNNVIVHPSNPSVWKAIYKREIVPKFDETLKAREDYFFNQELEKENHTKYYYDKVLYLYNSGRENSLTWKNERGEL